MPPKVPDQITVDSLRFKVYKLGDGRLSATLPKRADFRPIRRQNLEALQKACKEVATRILNAETAATVLTPEDRRIHIVARETLQPYGLEIDTAARIIRDAANLLGSPHRILEACRHFSQNSTSIESQATTPQIVAHFLRNLRADDLSADYITKLEADLRKFADTFPGTFSQIRTAEVSEWINAMPVGPRRRRKIRDQLVTLSNFARDHGYLPNALRTEAEKIKRPVVKRKAPAIYTPDELGLLLEQCAQLASAKGRRDYTDFLPSLAIGAFAGLRWAEIQRLEWRHIHWEDQVIEVGEENKTGYRLAPIQPNLMSWLAPYRDRHGHLCLTRDRRGILIPSKYPYKIMRRLGERAGLPSGGRRYANGLRHSWATYRVAVTKNMPLVAQEGGHSVSELRKSYNRASLEKIGTAWFSITRDAQNVLQMPLLNFRAK